MGKILFSLNKVKFIQNSVLYSPREPLQMAAIIYPNNGLLSLHGRLGSRKFDQQFNYYFNHLKSRHLNGRQIALSAKLPKVELGIGLAITEARVPGHSNGINPPKLIDCKSGASDMEEPIVVVNANEAACLELCTGLQKEHFRTTALHSLMALEGEVQESVCRVVIMDLDNLPVDNRFFRELKRKNPRVHIVGLSSRPFHPELEEAMSSHISSCLTKPLDMEELLYWLRSVCQEETNI